MPVSVSNLIPGIVTLSDFIASDDVYRGNLPADPAFQAAAAQASAGRPFILVIPPGTYRLAASVTIPSNVLTIVGPNVSTTGPGTVTFNGFVYLYGSAPPNFVTNSLAAFPSGGVYIGNSPWDPGQSNLAVQGRIIGGYPGTAGIVVRRNSVATAVSFALQSETSANLGEIGLASGAGAFTSLSQANDLVIRSTGGYRVVIALGTNANNWGAGSIVGFPSGGVYIGSLPSDPGANNLTVQGLAQAAGLAVTGDVGGATGRATFTNVTGIGNGAAANLTAPAQGTGSGPASLQVAAWLKVYDGTTVRWIPMFS